MRSAFDFSPLYRSTIGFDRLPGLLESVARLDESSLGYPPYNIEKQDEESYRITMAVAGFAEGDLDIQVRGQTLVVSGRMGDDGDDRTYLHRGIAGRAFQRSFEIADHVKVTGARLENGLLHIDLVRELPEEMKPRRIEIGTGPAFKQVTDGTKKAA
ncbi:Hsp20 family protein [Pelagibius marinus]|uniref:Hsp20 family protein n=1 Tax=Pelagibius marinus TaxID=2762760 RepID=UPI0018723836|nr:Hsp20 family protein [Pelagibius marinus]